MKNKLLICVLILAVFCFSFPGATFALTNVSSASVTVGNSLPTVTGVHINTTDGAITLTEGNLSNKFTVTGTVTDLNGCKDLTSVTVKVYKGLLASCVATDYDTCFVVTDASPASDTSCDVSPDTTMLITGTNIDVEVPYYAQDGTWYATIIPSDTTGAGTVVAGNTSPGSVVNTTRAVEVTASIAYGAVANGATSTTDHITVVTNTGNTATDYKLYGVDMTCDATGTIPVANQQYNAASFDHPNGTALGATPGADVDADLAAPTHATYTTDVFNEYWQILVPYNVVGVCSGNVTFTAEAWID